MNRDVFVVNNRTKMYHRGKCHYTQWIQKENRVSVDFRPRGYSPCSHCKPDQTTFTLRGGARL